MLEFRNYPTSDNPTLIGVILAASQNWEIGLLQKRNGIWVFIPDSSVSFYDMSWLYEIVGKLRVLNES